MTQRQLTQSLDDMFDVKGPDVDPAAAQWHNWAAKTSKQSVKDLNLSLFPFDSILKQQSRSSQTNSPSSVSPSQSSQRPSSSSPSSPSTQQQQQDDHAKEVVVDKRPAFMNNTIQHLFTDPPHCFCRQVASRSETDAFGVTYDCHLMTTDTPSTTGICGFHIHHDAWRAIGDMIRKDQLVDPNDPELSTCPWFNFTFCVTFSLSNTYKKQSPRGPNCFCQRQVVLSESDNKRNPRLCFVCPNFFVEGAKPKCSWFLWAQELAFIKPLFPRHNDQWLLEVQSRVTQSRLARSTISDSSNDAN